MPNRKINLNIKLTVISELTDKELLDAIYHSLQGRSDKRQGINMMAMIPYYIQTQLEENLQNSLPNQVHIESVSSQPKIEG